MNQTTSLDVSRRHFIAQTGLGLAAVSTTSLATAQGSAANTRLRLGVVGCGGRGQWITGLFQENSGYEIVAIADYFQGRIDENITKAKLTSVRSYTGLQCAEKMIAAVKQETMRFIK